jgi:hypothetical protein
VAPSIRKKLTITSPTSGGRSVGIVRSRTKAMEFFFPTLYISADHASLFSDYLSYSYGKGVAERERRIQEKCSEKVAHIWPSKETTP